MHRIFILMPSASIVVAINYIDDDLYMRVYMNDMRLYRQHDY